MQLYLPSYETIVDIHDIILGLTDGKPGIHIKNDILRAIERPKTYVSYLDDYGIDTVCAVLLDSISRYHGFNDGNKRTALMTTIFTYRVNGVYFGSGLKMNEELDELVIWVVTKKPEISKIEKSLKKLRRVFEVENKEPLATLMSNYQKMRNSKKAN